MKILVYVYVKNRENFIFANRVKDVFETLKICTRKYLTYISIRYFAVYSFSFGRLNNIQLPPLSMGAYYTIV